MKLDFLHPYWTGIKNKLPQKETTPMPPLLDKWVWFLCSSTPPHCKILSNRQPNCPECNLPMNETEKINPESSY